MGKHKIKTQTQSKFEFEKPKITYRTIPQIMEQTNRRSITPPLPPPPPLTSKPNQQNKYRLINDQPISDNLSTSGNAYLLPMSGCYGYNPYAGYYGYNF